MRICTLPFPPNTCVFLGGWGEIFTLPFPPNTCVCVGGWGEIIKRNPACTNRKCRAIFTLRALKKLREGRDKWKISRQGGWVDTPLKKFQGGGHDPTTPVEHFRGEGVTHT